jgi:hypothetical protein
VPGDRMDQDGQVGSSVAAVPAHTTVSLIFEPSAYGSV